MKLSPFFFGHNSNQATELCNKELKEQRKVLFLGESTRYRTALDAENQRSEQRWTLLYDAGKAPSNDVGDLSNAQDALAYERARFRANCATLAIRTTEDAEKAMLRIAVARAEVVREEKNALRVTLINCLRAGGSGRAR